MTNGEDRTALCFGPICGTVVNFSRSLALRDSPLLDTGAYF
jgi:hypothetical protein